MKDAKGKKDRSPMGYPLVSYHSKTLREVQQSMTADQYRCFLLARAKEGLRLAKTWEMLREPGSRKWCWVQANWTAATKVQTSEANLQKESQQWNERLATASSQEKKLLRSCRNRTMPMLLASGEVAEDFKDESVYASWLSEGGVSQEVRDWRLVASVLVWTASREYSNVPSQRADLVSSSTFRVVVEMSKEATSTDRKHAQAAFDRVAGLQTSEAITTKVLKSRGRQPCQMSLEKMQSNDSKSFLTLAGCAQTHSPCGGTNPRLLETRRRCEQLGLWSLIGAQLYCHGKARCVETTATFVENVLKDSEKTKVVKEAYHAIAIRQHRDPLLIQSTLEQKEFLPKCGDSDIRSENKRGRLLDGLSVPSLMACYEELAGFLHTYEATFDACKGTRDFAPLEKIEKDALELMGKVCCGNLDVHKNGGYSAKQIQDMVSSHLGTEASCRWLRHVWACPHRGDAETRFWGAGSNSQDAFKCSSHEKLPQVLERHSKKARLVKKITIALQPCKKTFELLVQPEHSCASALQLCACKASGCTKPLLSSHCQLSIKLGSPVGSSDAASR